MEDKMEDFLKEYYSFKQYAEEQQITANDAETIQLFAIFRKDKRSNEINGKKTNGDQTATEKQKAYIKSIYEKNGITFDEQEIQRLTKKQASEIINSLKSVTN